MTEGESERGLQAAVVVAVGSEGLRTFEVRFRPRCDGSAVEQELEIVQPLACQQEVLASVEARTSDISRLFQL